jgi:hypothetical protein
MHTKLLSSIPFTGGGGIVVCMHRRPRPPMDQNATKFRWAQILKTERCFGRVICYSTVKSMSYALAEVAIP